MNDAIILFMEQMNKLGTSEEVLDLSGIHLKLKSVYGYDAPSYMTLRRWINQGELTDSERILDADNPLKRKFYSVSSVERVFLQKPMGKRTAVAISKERKNQVSRTEDTSPDGQLTGAAFSSSPTSMSEVNSRMEMILDSVAILSTLVTEQGRVLTQCVESIARIDAVRKTLMNKYDSSSSAQSELNEMLRNKVKSLEKGVDVERAIMQLTAKVGQLSDVVQRSAKDMA